MLANLPALIRERIEVTDRCWLWTGVIKPDGYGQYDRNPAHRRVYQELIGPIPEGLQLDHLCEVLNCVNPAHLEPVTDLENKRRRYAKMTHCRHGHEFTPENTRIYRGKRICRLCDCRRTAACKERRLRALRGES